MPRFVILEHDFPTLHWDFMLEVNGVLRTWRLPQAPADGREMVAEALGDHRLAYLDYEGPVSNKRGSVKRWDRGQYEAMDEAEEGRWGVRLMGERLAGVVELTMVEGSHWSFLFQSVVVGVERGGAASPPGRAGG
jgi:hypothetical protein